MPVLLVAAAGWQDLFERQADFALPEPEHRFEVVGEKADIEVILREVQREILSGGAN
jgi:hypothetical protein